MPQPDALGLAARQAVDEHDGDIGIAAGAPQRARPERTWHRTG
jgi:predicted secreted protein